MEQKQENHSHFSHLSHVMRKPVYAICEQQRRRSACASTQIDQRLCCSLPRQYNTYTCYMYIQNIKTLASLCSWAGWFESYLVANPKERFSRDKAHLVWVGLWLRVTRRPTSYLSLPCTVVKQMRVLENNFNRDNFHYFSIKTCCGY